MKYLAVTGVGLSHALCYTVHFPTIYLVFFTYLEKNEQGKRKFAEVQASATDIIFI